VARFSLVPVPDRVSLPLLLATKKDQSDAMHFVQVVTAFFMDASVGLVDDG